MGVEAFEELEAELGAEGRIAGEKDGRGFADDKPEGGEGAELDL